MERKGAHQRGLISTWYTTNFWIIQHTKILDVFFP